MIMKNVLNCLVISSFWLGLIVGVAIVYLCSTFLSPLGKVEWFNFVILAIGASVGLTGALSVYEVILNVVIGD